MRAKNKQDYWQHRWYVPSESDPAKEYVVALSQDGKWGCTCPVYRFRKMACKHIQAVAADMKRYRYSGWQGVKAAKGTIEIFHPKTSGQIRNPHRGEQLYTVGIPKVYFRKPTKLITQMQDAVRVYARSRTEAAQKAWRETSWRWLPDMRTDIKYVSLYVNAPEAGTGGLIGRLEPIRVADLRRGIMGNAQKPLRRNEGDIVQGDRITWKEPVFEGFRPGAGKWGRKQATCVGERTITGTVIKESYGAARGQHTFTILVESSEGFHAVAPGTKILRKGRNLYPNLEEHEYSDSPGREAAAEDKHQRGASARQEREERWERGENPTAPLTATKREAMRQAQKLGHAMGAWGRGSYKHERFAFCKRCGQMMSVQPVSRRLEHPRQGQYIAFGVPFYERCVGRNPRIPVILPPGIARRLAKAPVMRGHREISVRSLIVAEKARRKLVRMGYKKATVIAPAKGPVELIVPEKAVRVINPAEPTKAEKLIADVCRFFKVPVFSVEEKKAAYYVTVTKPTDWLRLDAVKRQMKMHGAVKPIKFRTQGGGTPSKTGKRLVCAVCLKDYGARYGGILCPQCKRKRGG